MKKNLFIVMVFALTVFASCNKDEVFKIPTVTSPETETVVAGESVNLTFSYTTDGGFMASSVTAVNGTATVTTDGIAGSKSGTIEVSYTAGAAAGAGSVALSVTDNKSQSALSTAVLTVVDEQTVFSVDANISENTTWETGNVYILETRVAVLDGVTLTIEPSVVVKGNAGVDANATALLIARGAKLMAEGTATQPIIFTSVADNIEPGEIESPNLEPTLNGLWGGIIVLGKAPISVSGDATEAAIEGIPASDPNGLYGGTVSDDNSGVISYISIRHGGANIGEGNEINGLTLGGVGSGTTIENVEIVSNQDDGIEWFGGTVNVTNAVVWNTGDDAVDTDQSWAGTLDNFIVINPGDECFELDGPEGSMEARHTITNGTCKAEDAQGLVDLDANSIVTMSNIYFYDLADGQDFDLVPTGLTASNLEATLPAGMVLTDFFKDGSDSFTTSVTTNTVGADKTKFSGWSWAALAGAF